MSRLSFFGTEQPATHADLEAAERNYSLKLPEDYKKHILEHNGGWPSRKSFWQSADDGRLIERRISDLYSIKYGGLTVEDSLEDLHDQLHPDLVPFGSETGGDQFCLSVGPEDYGAVYYVAHEFYTPPKNKERKMPRQYGQGVTFLAPSFTAFMEALVDVPEV